MDGLLQFILRSFTSLSAVELQFPVGNAYNFDLDVFYATDDNAAAADEGLITLEVIGYWGYFRAEFKPYGLLAGFLACEGHLRARMR